MGGILLVRYAFALRRMERIVTGIAAGFVLFIVLSNLFAHVLPLTGAFWAASILILAGGLLLAWRSKKQPLISNGDLRSIPLLIGLMGITVLFVLILRGQSIFDEYLHLPLISIMGAGDIPPHFYLNPGFYFAYHYAIQVFAASLVKLSSFFPWSAWDLSRALAIGFTLVLGWIWVRKVTGRRLAAWVGAVLFTFAGGSRWLLLLLPASWLNWMSQGIQMTGSGLTTAATLSAALHKSWVIVGAGPVPFPFAYHNGIFVPVFFTLGGSGALPFIIIFLLLLLLPQREFSTTGLIIWVLLFAALALSAEHIFAIVWAGIALAIMISFIFSRKIFSTFPRSSAIQWLIILLLSAGLAILQGGFITETARNLLASVASEPSQSYNAGRFYFRWPPGYPSSHLGSLSPFNPRQLVVLLAELGPVIFTVPLLFIRFKKKLQHKDWLIAGLTISVMIGLAIPLFIQYEVDRDTNRMLSGALWISLVLSFPIIWMALDHLRPVALAGILIGLLICAVGGFVIFRIQLYSIKTPQYSYYIDGLDAGFTRSYWNQLPEGAQVLDHVPGRAVTIFGDAAKTSSSIYDPLPEWQALIADPNPKNVAAAGYDYVYMDRQWWDALTPTQQAYFRQPCVDILDERTQDEGQNIRLLIDVRACKTSP